MRETVKCLQFLEINQVGKMNFFFLEEVCHTSHLERRQIHSHTQPVKIRECHLVHDEFRRICGVSSSENYHPVIIQ